MQLTGNFIQSHTKAQKYSEFNQKYIFCDAMKNMKEYMAPSVQR
jgi:hypothetical protein